MKPPIIGETNATIYLGGQFDNPDFTGERDRKAHDEGEDR
jgi:hypothetical protein